MGKQIVVGFFVFVFKKYLLSEASWKDIQKELEQMHRAKCNSLCILHFPA